MKKISYIIVLLLLVSVVSAQRNVVLIIADDLGTDYFGFYEDHVDTAATPNIRSLLARGVRFTNMWSNPICSATRAGILTGRYSFRTGVGGAVGDGSGTLGLDEITIPRMLENWQPGEIAKANIGKWHLHNPMPNSNFNNPILLGYDHFQGVFIGALQDYYNWTKVTNGVAGNVTTYATTETVNDAIAWTNNTSEPFFLWLAFNAPHSPYHLPPLDLHSFDGLPGTTQHINQNRKLYFRASIEALDTEVGRLFESLALQGKLDSTDFIFIGDNGNSEATSQIPVAGHGKGTIYHYGVHVPCIIAGPSVDNQGRVSDALANTTDLFGTILELFGHTDWQSQVAPDKPVDSRSLMPILKDTAEAVREWAFSELFTDTIDATYGKTMRNHDYKLLRFDSGAEAFYHLASDVHETNDLLLGALTVEQLANYEFLCNEMTQLVGSGNFCSPTVDATNLSDRRGQILAYPNPSRGSLAVEINDPILQKSLLSLSLYDAAGQLVFDQKTPQAAPLHINGLPAGVYFLKATFTSGQIHQKVIVGE